MISRSQMPRELYNKGTMPARNKKNFRSTKSGAGMTRAGVKAYRRLNPGSKLKTAVTGKVKPLNAENHTALDHWDNSNDHQQKHVTIQILVSVRHEEDGSVKWMN